MRRITRVASMCFGSGIWTRMPCTASSAFNRSMRLRSSASVVSAGNSIVTPSMPASSDAFRLARTYTALAGSVPTRITVSPGLTPRADSAAASRATCSRRRRAIATPSTISAGKVHRPRLADDDDLDLPRVLELRLDAARDLLGERCHADIVDIVRCHDYPDLTAGLDRVHLLDPAVAGRNPLETLQPLDVRLEGLAT